MASNKKISDLDTITSVDGSEMIPIVKGGNNFKLLLSQIKTWMGLASTSTSGLMSAADKQKLAGIAEEATANAKDTELRDRSTHTGTQPASSIENLKTVATTGVYSDLTGLPDLSPNSLGAAPISHVGSGGSDQHPLATEDTAGFMSPGMVALLGSAKKLAFTAEYVDISNRPWNSVAPMGFVWWPDSYTTSGSAHNGHDSFGTPVYSPMATTGSKYKDATEYHTYTSAASTYSVAGLRSQKPIVKIGTGAHQGGFLFEALVHWTYAAESCMVIGVCADGEKAFGNWEGAVSGVAVGWNASDTGASTIKAMAGNGTTSTRHNATAGQLQDDATYRVRIEVVSDVSTEGATLRNAIVTVTNMETGVNIIDGIQIPTEELPPGDTPLYAMIEYGTLAGANSISVDMLGWSCQRYRGF